jgi:hypothetical protein
MMALCDDRRMMMPVLDEEKEDKERDRERERENEERNPRPFKGFSEYLSGLYVGAS